MIRKFVIYENLQQAEKFVNSKDNDKYKKSYDSYLKIKEYLKNKGKLGYLYLFSLISYSRVPYNKMIQCIDEIINHNIKIDVDYWTKEITKYNMIDGWPFIHHVNWEMQKIVMNKFIDKWAPGFLKPELKKPENLIEVRSIFFDPKYNVNIVDDINTDLLRGKMSMFKTPKEWIDYLKKCKKESDISNIEKIKKSESRIYYEDDNWIVYVPFTYESLNSIIFPNWCTVVKYEYEKYSKERVYWVIMFNKKVKQNSYIAQITTDQSNENTSFTFHNYIDTVLWDYRYGNKKFNKEIILNNLKKENYVWYTGKQMTENEKFIFELFLNYFDKFKNENKG